MLNKESRVLSNTKLYIFAFCIPVIVILCLFLLVSVYPFGDNAILFKDLKDQYIPFLEEYKNRILQGQSIFHSWQSGLGVDFYAIFAYYTASPLNLLVLFFSKSHITEFVHFIILLKTGLSGLSLAFFLNKGVKPSSSSFLKQAKPLAILVISSFYALSAFSIGYGPHIMWMDSWWLLPLVVFSIQKIVDTGAIRGFVFSITFALLSNYYTAFFLCVFSIFYFFAYLLLKRPALSFYFYLKNFLLIILACVYSLGISFAHWYTVLKLLKKTGASAVENLGSSIFNFNILTFISRHTLGQKPTVFSGPPNLYFGVFFAILVVGFFFNTAIPKREKKIYGFLLLFLISSLCFTPLDYIWHGGHDPIGMSYRYAFIYVFIALVIAYKSFLSFDKLRLTPYVSIVFVWSIFLILTLIQTGFVELFFLNLMIIASYCLIFFLPSKKHLFIFTLLIIELVSHVLISSQYLYYSDVYQSREDFIDEMSEIEDLTSYLKKKEPVFFRIGKEVKKTSNDGALYGYNGLSVFSSTANHETTKTLFALGIHSNNFNSYEKSTSPALLDMLFGIKYIITPQQTAPDIFSKTINDLPPTKLQLQERLYTLPLAYRVDETITEPLKQTHLVFTNHLSFLKQMGIDADLLYNNPSCTYLTSKTSSWVKPSTEEGSRHTLYLNKNENASGSFTVQAPEKEQIYLKITTPTPLEICITDSNKRIIKHKVRITNGIINLGFLHTKEHYTIKIEKQKETTTKAKVSLDLVSINEDKLKDIYSTLNQEALTLQEVSDTVVKGSITVKKQGVLFFSIPESKAWKIRIDNIETKFLDNNKGFLMANIDPGTHMVELTYISQDFQFGLYISFFSTLLFIIHLVLSKRHKKRIR